MNPKLSASLEDYLETILRIAKDRGRVRICDIVRYQQVRAPSVIEALGHLVSRNLVARDGAGQIGLTPAGRKVARDVYTRHRTLKKFFREVLFLGEDEAEVNACRIEHILSRRAITRMSCLQRYLARSGSDKPCWGKASAPKAGIDRSRCSSRDGRQRRSIP